MVVQDGQRKASSAAAEAQSMECASAVAAVAALATGLGAFLAPQLPRVLGVLLDARALACAAHGIAASAAGARGALTAAVPPRLLLPPLYAHLPHALRVRLDVLCSVLPQSISCIKCTVMAGYDAFQAKSFSVAALVVPLTRHTQCPFSAPR